MVQKYIVDKGDISRLLNGEEIPLEQGSKARAFCVEIVGGMTNGEVIQALFPYVKIENTSFRTVIGTNLDKGVVPVKRDWWNAPYKAESEGKNNGKNNN